MKRWIVCLLLMFSTSVQSFEPEVEQLADKTEFKHLKFYDSWHRRNIHQTYMQLEAEQ